MMNFELLPQVRLSTMAVELPRAISPAMAGAAVGATLGVLAFVVALLLLGRRARRAAEQRRDVLRVAPYVTFADAPGTSPLPPVRVWTPSSELSARAFAKMDEDAGSDPELEIVAEIEVDAEYAAADDDLTDEGLVPSPPPAVAVSPVVILSGPPRDEASASGPHPAAVIPASSSAMRGASIADLDMDDSPTEIGETFFDEPPQPKARAPRPQIRAVAPAPPRFAVTPALPVVTPTPRADTMTFHRHP